LNSVAQIGGIGLPNHTLPFAIVSRGSIASRIPLDGFGSLDLQITSVARSAATGYTRMQVARVVKIDARPSSGGVAAVAAPLTHHQIEQVIAGYTPAVRCRSGVALAAA
jgi:hypothetical protein